MYQGRYKSFPVETEEYFYQVVRYVERNALRAGLVERADQRPPSLAREHRRMVAQNQMRDLGRRLRRIQRDGRHARHKHDIFFRLDAKRKGPVDRIYIADVDVIVHDHGDLAELGSKTPGPAHDGARLDGMTLFNRDNQIGRGAAGLEEMDAADGKTEVFDEMFV